MKKLLQINYKLSSSVNDFLSGARAVADLIAGVEGLEWKIWLKNEELNEGGGIYLFESEAAMNRFINGPIVENLKSHPDISDVSAKVFDVPTDLSAITRGLFRGATGRRQRQG
jgi:hypothetical protein